MTIGEQYLNKFGEFPELPKLITLTMIEPLMEEAIKRNSPLTFDEIVNKFQSNKNVKY